MRVPVLHWLETVEADPGDWSQLVHVVSLGLLRLNPTQVGCLRCTGRLAWVIYVSPRHGATGGLGWVLGSPLRPRL